MKTKYPRMAVVTGSRVIGGTLRVDVAYTDPGAADRNVPVVAAAGTYAMPRSDDRVLVDEAEDGSIFAQPVSVRSPGFDVPDLEEGEFELRFDDSTAISVRKNGSGFSVTVEADEVKLGGSGATKVVAREGDSVEVSSALEGTLTGTITSGASKTRAE
ncbi:baseplate assembly protein V [Halorubrum tailed virus 27]|uniref:Baseplate assembly protein V n=1 Tax=Halorubrum tailed virus 27 TaxID=2878008 RepID=A0AAE9BYB7_9CAUD|nr:baseplate assembly protein V [Halorubrum tailed virus 27]UBF22719.1 baseplate assembly protein V [Halorubrum tailed virus 27]